MSKAARIPIILADAALIFCGAFASIAAAPLTYSVPFAIGPLAASAAVVALLLALAFDLKRGGIVFGLIFLIGSVSIFAVSHENVIPGARVVVFKVLSAIFNSEAFELKAEYLHGMTSVQDAATWFLAAAAAVLSFFISLFAVKWKKLLPCILIPIPFLLICLVFTNLHPPIWCIAMLLVYLGGAFMSIGVKRRDPDKGGLFTALAIPVLALLIVGFTLAFPEKDYTPIPFEQRREMLGTRLGELQDGILRLYSHNPVRYDLAREKDRKENNDRQLFISASRAGSYLLRTHSYGAYGDSAWLPAEEYGGEWTSMDALGKGMRGVRETVSIFASMTDEKYVPYKFISKEGVTLGESGVRASGETAYSWEIHPFIPELPRSDREGEEEYYRFALSQYTMPDGDEKRELLKLINASGVKRGKNDYETALSVAAFVRSSGEYTLEPGMTPAGEDFVLYFLKEGRRGYCVHFASATTALLQAMGIPARYTVGCHADVPETGVWYEIPQKNSHAWTEVYVKGMGWLPVESTPGFRYGFFGEDMGSGNESPAPTESVPTPRPGETDPETSDLPDTRPERTGRPDASERPASQKPERTSTPGGDRPHGGGSGHGGGGDGEGDGEAEPAFNFPTWAVVLGAAVVWLSIGAVMRKRREDRFKKGDARKAVLSMVRYHGMLVRLFRVPKSPELSELAEEAAFSDHDMEEQRAELCDFIDSVRHDIGMESGLRWFVFRRLLFVL